MIRDQTEFKGAVSFLKDYIAFLAQSDSLPSVTGIMHFAQVACDCESFVINNSPGHERIDLDPVFAEMRRALIDAGYIRETDVPLPSAKVLQLRDYDRRARG